MLAAGRGSEKRSPKNWNASQANCSFAGTFVPNMQDLVETVLLSGNFLSARSIGIPGPGVLGQIIIDKYTDHLPVHRQIQRFEREGIKLPASTLTDWISGTCLLLEPLYEVHRKQVLSSNYLQVDETPIKV